MICGNAFKKNRRTKWIHKNYNSNNHNIKYAQASPIWVNCTTKSPKWLLSRLDCTYFCGLLGLCDLLLFNAEDNQTLNGLFEGHRTLCSRRHLLFLTARTMIYDSKGFVFKSSNTLMMQFFKDCIHMHFLRSMRRILVMEVLDIIGRVTILWWNVASTTKRYPQALKTANMIQHSRNIV